MAKRYSGDAEVRVLWDPKKRIYRGSVRDPYVRWRGTAPRPSRVRGTRIPHRASNAYDLMAALFLRRAQQWAFAERGHRLMVEEEHGKLQVRRIFQAPCPLGEVRTRRRGHT